MDDFFKTKVNDGEKIGLDEKKIEFKFVKEKRASRTYVLNLEHYVNDPVKLELLLKNIKKSMGTGCIKKETEFGLGYGFNGDLKNRIIQYLIENEIVTKNAFK